MKHEKSILNRAEREQSPLNGARLIFKWTVSRGRETYGLNICTLYVQTGWNKPKKVASCTRCGYDVPGACLAEYMQAHPEQISEMLYFSTVMRRIERIGDRLSNIAEDLVFYIDAKELRHRASLKKAKEEAE